MSFEKCKLFFKFQSLSFRTRSSTRTLSLAKDAAGGYGVVAGASGVAGVIVGAAGVAATAVVVAVKFSI